MFIGLKDNNDLGDNNLRNKFSSLAIAFLLPLSVVALALFLIQDASAKADEEGAYLAPRLSNTFSCSAPVRIMPLGDSITRGATDTYPGSYRQALHLSLTAAGHDVNFVGSQLAPTATPTYDRDNEGHSGYDSWEIASGIYNWLSSNPADVILLHIGTNDIQSGSSDIHGVEEILDEIDRYESNFNTQIIVVISARIIKNLNNLPLTEAFNDNLEAMATARQATDDLVLVYHEDALNYTDDMADPIHPNKSGFTKMSQVWQAGVEPLLPDCFSSLFVRKNAFNSPIQEGSDAKFRIRVRNTGQLYLYSVNVVDSRAPDCNRALGDLDIGESRAYTCSINNLTGDLLNEVEVTATVWSDIGLVVTGTASALVDVIHPALEITSTALPLVVHAGEASSFTAQLTNGGDSSLMTVTVSSSLPECSLSGPSGDNGDGLLQPAEVWNYNCSLIAGNSSFTNTVTATAMVEAGGTVSASSSASVKVIHPSLTAGQSATPQKVHASDTVTFTVIVTNDGDSVLSSLVMESDVPGCTFSAPFGDDGDGLLQPSESWSAGCSVLASDADITGTVSLSAVDETGDMVTTSAMSVVDVLHPALEAIAAARPHWVNAGEPVTFSVLLSNSGDSLLGEVILDSDLDGCTFPVLPAGKWLKPGESMSFSCVVSGIDTDLTNTVTITAVDEIGAVLEKSAIATAYVNFGPIHFLPIIAK